MTPTRSTRFLALVPAAGSGRRLGGELPKQYLPLAGRPMLWHTLSRLATHPRIDAVAVVLAPDDPWFGAMAWAGPAKVSVHPCGGGSRAETVRNGLHSLKAEAHDDDWVLVHDAARPCVTHALLDRLIATLAGDPVGGIAALPVADTLKRAGADGRIDSTVPRDGLWAAQTPQMFRYGLLCRALELAPLGEVTDEASAVERLGLAPRLVEGDPGNFKVTYPGDAERASAQLAATTEDPAVRS